jgi:hypothetical protein
VDSDINYARVVRQKNHAEAASNSQHAVEDNHTVEAYLALIPNFRIGPVKRNSNGGHPAPVSAGDILRVAAAVLNCRGSDIDSVPDQAVEHQCFPYSRSFLLCLVVDTHAAAVDTATVVVKDVVDDADNRVVVVVVVDHQDRPYSRGYSCAREDRPYFRGCPCVRGDHHPYSRGCPCARDLHCERLLPGRVPARKSHPVSCLHPHLCNRVPNYGPEPGLVSWHRFLLPLYWYPLQNEWTWLPWSRSVGQN